jgi:hypothetical protein
VAERTQAANVPESSAQNYQVITLQAIMEMQKSIGGLTEAVGALKMLTEKQGNKLDAISHRICAAGVIITIAVPLLSFPANLFGVQILSALHLAAGAR